MIIRSFLELNSVYQQSQPYSASHLLEKLQMISYTAECYPYIFLQLNILFILLFGDQYSNENTKRKEAECLKLALG